MATAQRTFDLNGQPNQLNRIEIAVSESVHRRLTDCPYSYCFNRVVSTYAFGTLTLEGSVASFYLKQVLQSLLRDMEYVDRIANYVQVVNSTGLSSEPDREHLANGSR